MTTKKHSISIKSYLIYFLVGLLAVTQIIISNHLSSSGKKLSVLTNQTNKLKLENERIKKKIASSSAITVLTKKANEHGFTEKPEVIYLDELYSVAQNSL